ncbi:MAG: amidase [Syntrophothermus sp.]
MKSKLLLPALIFICLITGAFIGVQMEKISGEDVSHGQRLIGMNFTTAETDSMLPALNDQRSNYLNMRKIFLSNNVPPAFEFNPIPQGEHFQPGKQSFILSGYEATVLPGDIDQLAWYSVGQLSALIHQKRITSENLTRFFIERLKKSAPVLHCVITYTEVSAMEDAKRADRELAAGKDRGYLHGIPYGIKDMFSTKNYPTTYGTPPYKDQLINEDASVVKKLREAGAVMIAKLSLGELAMDDVWFGGKTRNPWDTSKGSSGSSAGPAAAVAAGLVPFAIGSETWGSIVSPSTVCGVTGLRPTYGRVSWQGAMALSWSMDKIGPLCKTAEDCAIVFNYIYGPDGIDQTVYDIAFDYKEVKMQGLKIGYFPGEFDRDTSLNKPFNEAALVQLKKMGAQLVPFEMPAFPYMDMSIILMAEAAAAFDELTFSDKDDLMVQQNKDRWPNLFRAAHFIPATDYIRASRLRYLLIREWNKMMKQVDVCIAPSLAGDNLLATNLTGNPCMVLPNGFLNPTTPTSIVFIGQLFGEGTLVSVAKQYQVATGFHLKHPAGY